MTTPKRPGKRRPYLDAAAVPVEKALLARAEVLDAKALAQAIDEIPWAQVAAEFRDLAEELHWHG